MTRAAGRPVTVWRGLMGTGAVAAAVLGLLVFTCVFVAVAGPRESLALRTGALRHAVSTSSPLARSVAGSIDYTAFTAGLGRPPGGRDLVAARVRLAASLKQERLPLAPDGTSWSGFSSGFSTISGVPRRLTRGGIPPQMELLYRERLTRHARLIAGQLPASARLTSGGGVFQVAVTRATAARFGLRPGMRIRMRAGPPAGIVLAVTGVVQPAEAGSGFWMADPIAARPALMERSDNQPAFWNGAVFIGPGEVRLLPRRLDPASMSLSWDFPLRLGSLTASQAPALERELSAASARAGLAGSSRFVLRAPAPVTISSGMTGLLASYVQQDNAAGQLLSLLSVSLAVIGVVVLLLGAQLMAEHRRSEFAVMQARGASPRQLAVLALAACAIATVPAAAAGSALAVALTRGPPAPLAWLLAGVAVLAALASPPLITLRAHRLGRQPIRRGRLASASRLARLRRLSTDAALVAAAAGGLAVLRLQGQPAAGGGAVFASLAPVLAATPAAILVVRCYPLLMRMLLRWARMRPGVTALAGFARAAQVSPRTVLPVFALVLAVSVVAFGATVRSAILRGQSAVSWARTGADAVIDASASARPLTSATERAITAVPGIRRTAAITVLSGSARGTALTVVAVRPREYAALIAATPAAAFPAAELAGAAAASGGSFPALASPAAAALLGRSRSVIGIGNRNLPIRVRGIAPKIPGVSSQALVVLPQRALGNRPPAPTVLLAVGPGLDVQRLAAIVHRSLPGAAVTLRVAVLASLTGAPLPHSAYLAVAAATAAAAGLSVLIVLAMLVLSAPERERMIARLRVSGLSPGQARWLLTLEVLPQFLAAAAGGIASAWGLTQLVGPALNLSVFTGAGPAVIIRAQPALLTAAAAGLVFLALLTVAAEGLAADRRRLARAVAVAE